MALSNTMLWLANKANLLSPHGHWACTFVLDRRHYRGRALRSGSALWVLRASALATQTQPSAVLVLQTGNGAVLLALPTHTDNTKQALQEARHGQPLDLPVWTSLTQIFCRIRNSNKSQVNMALTTEAALEGICT